MSIETQNKKVFFLWSIFFFSFIEIHYFLKRPEKIWTSNVRILHPSPPRSYFSGFFIQIFFRFFLVVRVFKPPPPSLISDSITNKKKCLIDFLPTSSPLKARVHGWTETHGRTELSWIQNTEVKGRTYTHTDRPTDRQTSYSFIISDVYFLRLLENKFTFFLFIKARGETVLGEKWIVIKKCNLGHGYAAQGSGDIIHFVIEEPGRHEEHREQVPVYLSIYLYIYLSSYISIHISIYLYPSIYLSIYLLIYLSIYLCTYLYNT